jgi:methionyl-tRNA formyltransferase
VETVEAILSGTVKSVPQEAFYQDEAELRPAPKIFKDTCRIPWQRGVKAVYDFVRGLSPYPAAWTELVLPDGTRQVLKVYETAKQWATHTLPVGTVVTDHKHSLRVAVADGYVELLSVQLAGKKRMAVGDFLRGYRMSDEARVE